MKNSLITLSILGSLLAASSASATVASIPALPPQVIISNITGTTATLSKYGVTKHIAPKSGFHFEYIEAHKACPAIYPPLPGCSPAKTKENVSPVTIDGLVPGKTYSVALVTKEQVVCVKAPCDPIESRSESVEFTTTSKTSAGVLALDIKNISSTGATVSLNESTLSGLSADDKKRIYFTYQEANIACKKDCSVATSKGVTATIIGLKSNTAYKVRAVKDSSIQCIAAPCPTNFTYGDEFTFTTLSATGTNPVIITQTLRMGSSGKEVKTLQNFLITKGFMSGKVTGYFGVSTLKSLKAFQKSAGLPPTGNTGPKTREAINNAK